MPRHTYGSAGIARYRVAQLERELGRDHPATRAAYGRFLGRTLAAVPQRGSTTPEAIAWARESGAAPGYSNTQPQRDAQGAVWAQLCQAHRDKLEAAIAAGDVKKMLGYWVAASGGAKAMAGR